MIDSRYIKPVLAKQHSAKHAKCSVAAWVLWLTHHSTGYVTQAAFT